MKIKTNNSNNLCTILKT